jgi:hypothetical protein
MGSLWIQAYRLNPSKPSSQESRGFNHGSVKSLSVETTIFDSLPSSLRFTDSRTSSNATALPTK